MVPLRYIFIYCAFGWNSVFGHTQPPLFQGSLGELGGDNSHQTVKSPTTYGLRSLKMGKLGSRLYINESYSAMQLLPPSSSGQRIRLSTNWLVFITLQEHQLISPAKITCLIRTFPSHQSRLRHFWDMVCRWDAISWGRSTIESGQKVSTQRFS